MKIPPQISNTILTVIGAITTILGALNTVLGWFNWLISLIGKFVPYGYDFFIRYAITGLGVSLLVHGVCNIIIKSKKFNPNTGRNEDEFPKARRWAKFFRWFIYVLYVTIGVLLYFKDKKHCESLADTPAIFVTRFSEEKGDLFCTNLKRLLDRELPKEYKYAINFRDVYIDAPDEGPIEGIGRYLECHKKGILIHGTYNQAAQSFLCSIHVKNLKESDSTVEYFFREPDFINFKGTTVRAEAITDFVVGLIHYYNENNSMSIAVMKLLVNSAIGNSDFLGYSCLFAAYNCAALNQFDSLKVYLDKANTLGIKEPMLLQSLQDLEKVADSLASASLSNGWELNYQTQTGILPVKPVRISSVFKMSDDSVGFKLESKDTSNLILILSSDHMKPTERQVHHPSLRTDTSPLSEFSKYRYSIYARDLANGSYSAILSNGKESDTARFEIQPKIK